MRKRLRELANERRQFADRRLHLLEREGITMHYWNQLYRFYRE